MYLWQDEERWRLEHLRNGKGQLKLGDPPSYPKGGCGALLTAGPEPNAWDLPSAIHVKVMNLDGSFEYRHEIDL